MLQGSKTVGCIQAEIPTFRIRTVDILGAVQGLGLVIPGVQQVFSSEGYFPIVGEALREIEIQ